MIFSLSAAESGFSIDKIKELLDGLDPAALLPKLSTIVGKSTAICRLAVLLGPLVLLALGLAYLFLAPKEANHYFGYRTYFGMGSVRAWRFTQRLAGLVLGGTGLVLTVVMLLVSGGFAGLAPMDMAWKAVWCLVWEAGLALMANVIIIAVAAMTFTAKGELRKN